MEIEIKAKVSMPQGTKIFQGDCNVDEIVVTTDRVYNGQDISKLNGYIKIKYPDDSCNQIAMYKRDMQDNFVVFFAKIDKNITKNAGALVCQPYFTNDDFSVCMSATCFVLQIEPSIQAYETIEQNLLPNTIETLEYQLKITQQNFQKDIYAVEGSENAITSNAVYTMFKSVDLGAFKQAEFDEVLKKTRESGIYKISLLNEDSTLKQTMLLCVYEFDRGFCRQTLFSFEDKIKNFFKVSHRGIAYLTGTAIDLWTHDEIALKSYVDEKLGLIEDELGGIMGV